MTADEKRRFMDVRLWFILKFLSALRTVSGDHAKVCLWSLKCSLYCSLKIRKRGRVFLWCSPRDHMGGKRRGMRGAFALGPLQR